MRQKCRDVLFWTVLYIYINFVTCVRRLVELSVHEHSRWIRSNEDCKNVNS